MSDLALDPVSILPSNCYRFVAVVGLIIPLLFVNPAINSSQNNVRYCHCIVYWLGFRLVASRLVMWSEATRLDTRHGLRRRCLVSFRLPACGIIFSFPIRIDPLVNILSRWCCRLHCFYRCFTWYGNSILGLVVLVLLLLMMRDFFFSLLLPSNTTIFSSSTNTTFLFLLTTRVVLLRRLDPYSYCSCSCRCYCCCSCIMTCRLDTRGFSFRVGLGTKCTQYLFRDHFFLANPLLDTTSSMLLFYSY